MLDFGFLPTDTRCDIQFFQGDSTLVAGNWKTWTRPRGTSMSYIYLCGAGGGGGNSVVGAASTAAGGGGGASGTVMSLIINNRLVPDTLFLSLAAGNPAKTTTGVGTNFASYITVIQSATGVAPIAQNTVVFASAGNSGGAASGATAGVAGTAGTTPAITNALLAGLGFYNFFASSVGIIGGTTVAGGALTLPTTGLLCTGGTGGGGLPAANTAGTAGGLITGIALGAFVPANIAGGAGGTTAPTAGSNGVTSPMRSLWKNVPFTVGGTGGGSSGLTVTPTGAAGGNGGVGGFGSGGGGGGGGFTGATAAVGGAGGPSYCFIISW